MNEKLVKFLVFIFTGAIHLALIFFLVFTAEVLVQEPTENAKVMKVTDLAEQPPPPQLPENPDIPQVEEIAENMIETDIIPIQEVVSAGSLSTENFENYLQMHQVSIPPVFDTNEITSALVYPPIALRSGVEGRVILELYVDRIGVVQRVTILLEDPQERGFGDAATKAMMGRKGTPAYANGTAVSCRYRYPLRFVIK